MNRDRALELEAAARSALDSVAAIHDIWPEQAGILHTLDPWRVRDLQAAITCVERDRRHASQLDDDHNPGKA